MVIFCYDVLIIGFGVVGFIVVLGLFDSVQVVLLFKGEFIYVSMYYVQGGVVVVFDSDDFLESYVCDIYLVGGGLCYDDVVCYMVENGL